MKFLQLVYLSMKVNDAENAIRNLALVNLLLLFALLFEYLRIC